MKKEISKKVINILFWLGVVILPAACFFLLLNIDLPSNIINLFSPFQLMHFLGLLLVYYLFFHLRGKYSLLLGCLLTALIFALPFAVRLSSGLSNATVIGGFIPYKDGFYYYNGANMLLSGQPISQNGLQGAFRPLFPGLISLLLLFTKGNLLISLSLMVLALAFTCFLAAQMVNEEYGPLPGAVFFALVYAFIRPMIGDTLTEIPSLTFACLAFILLFKTAKTRSFLDAVLGGIMLILALSIRAGAFFILPLLILWLGWLFSGDKKISIKKMVIFSAIFLTFFIIFNMLFPRLVTAKGDSTFGNFSWMLYGQAVGGAGWDYHLEALGTHDSTVVMQAALDRIRDYPLGLLIGFFKSYRDFFTNNSLGMFDLLSGGSIEAGWFFWLLMIALLLFGVFKSVRNLKKPLNGLLFACFIGTLLSIPFLPPIDGGNRFYSGSVPFLFALMAFRLPSARIIKAEKFSGDYTDDLMHATRAASFLLLLLIILGPMLVLRLNSVQDSASVVCPAEQVPFTARYTNGSYVDILPEGSTSCGLSPSLCLQEFIENGVDQTTDDFFNALVEIGSASQSGIRLWAGVESDSRQYYFMVMPLELVEHTASAQSFSGCAQKLKTQFQNFLKIETVR